MRYLTSLVLNLAAHVAGKALVLQRVYANGHTFGQVCVYANGHTLGQVAAVPPALGMRRVALVSVLRSCLFWGRGEAAG